MKVFPSGPSKVVSVSTVRMFRDNKPWVVVAEGRRYVGSKFTTGGPCEGFSPSPGSARLRTNSELVLHDPVDLGEA